MSTEKTPAPPIELDATADLDIYGADGGAYQQAVDESLKRILPADPPV